MAQGRGARAGLAVAAMVAALVTGPRTLSADVSNTSGTASSGGPGVPGLEKLLDESGLKYSWNDKHTVARINFSDIKNADVHTVIAFVPDEKGYYVKLLLTLIDKPEGYKFPPALLKDAMGMNDRMWLMRVGLDEKNGDIDAIIGIDQENLTGKLLKDYVLHLANTGDDVAKTLKEYIAD